MARNSAALTEVAVLNQALALMGEDPVNSFSSDGSLIPETSAGERCAMQYMRVLSQVQREFYWEELITKAIILPRNLFIEEFVYNQDTDTVLGPDGGEYDSYVINHSSRPGSFSLPDNCLRVLAVDQQESEQGLTATTYTRSLQSSEMDYEVYGSVIWVEGVESITLWYVRLEKQPNLWSSELLDAIVYALASETATHVKQDMAVAANLRQTYESLVKPQSRRLQSKYKSSRNRYPHRYHAIRARRHYS